MTTNTAGRSSTQDQEQKSPGDNALGIPFARPENDALTSKDVAELFGCTPSTAVLWARTGRFNVPQPSWFYFSGKDYTGQMTYYWPRQQIMDFLASNPKLVVRNTKPRGSRRDPNDPTAPGIPAEVQYINSQTEAILDLARGMGLPYHEAAGIHFRSEAAALGIYDDEADEIAPIGSAKDFIDVTRDPDGRAFVHQTRGTDFSIRVTTYAKDKGVPSISLKLSRDLLVQLNWAPNERVAFHLSRDKRSGVLFATTTGKRLHSPGDSGASYFTVRNHRLIGLYPGVSIGGPTSLDYDITVSPDGVSLNFKLPKVLA